MISKNNNVHSSAQTILRSLMATLKSFLKDMGERPVIADISS
jgi:hypothetical protein